MMDVKPLSPVAYSVFLSYVDPFGYLGFLFLE